MTEQQNQAALLIAQGKLTLEAIAKQTGAGYRSVKRWNEENPDFQAAVATHKASFQQEAAAWRAKMSAEGLAKKEERVFAKMRRHAQLKKVQRAIANWFAQGGPDNPKSLPQYLAEIGVAAGLVCIRYKGKEGDVPEFAINTAMLQGYDELEREIAIEVGQYKQQVEHSTAPEPPSQKVLLLASLPAEVLKSIKLQFEVQIQADASSSPVQEPGR